MTLSHRFSRNYLLLSYSIVSSLPFLGFIQGKTVEQPGVLLVGELLSWLVLWSLFKRPRWFHILLLPAFCAIPIEVYLRLYFGQGISTHHFGVITETSPREAMEFLGRRVWLVLLVTMLVLGWWWSLWRAAWRCQNLPWEHRSRWWAVVLIALATGAWFYGQAVGVASAASSNAAESTASTPSTKASKSLWDVHSVRELEDFLDEQPPLPSWAAPLYDTETFSHSWPLGIWVVMSDFYHERSYLATLSEKNLAFRFHARQSSGKHVPQTIIVVIGESSRFDRWSINGYARETNPYLSQEENLISFSNMITAVSATRLSVPIISTRKSAFQSLKPGFSEKSFLSAYKEAGFKTFWLSNQMSFGQFDTPTSVIAQEADVTQFLNLGGYTDGSSFDQILLDPLQLALDDAAPNKLIVLHTLGNHWNYSHRYPKLYDKWQPSLLGVNKPAFTDLKNKEAINNSYDNSILYTDWFLARMILQLKEAGQLSALMYVSDHGQTLYDGSCNLAFHGHNTDYEFHIPAFVWFSDSYAAQFPQKVAQLRRHQHAKLTTENVFHSLLDLVDIRYPDEHLERSVFSTRLRPQKRYVDSYGWSNYDDAVFKGDCREIIDRKSPLIQEK